MKPSKVELKSVIESLKKEPELLTVRKALKYTPYYLKSEGLTKKLLKEIIRLWSEASEKIRVVCLLSLVRIYTRLDDKKKRQHVIKSLYTTFLSKCGIAKLETMSMISFMRHSLIQLYKIDPSIAYEQARTSCQQLAIVLKNAKTHKNEESYKTVLNWRFANCLILLSQLITSVEKGPIKSLTQQVIEMNIDAINILTSPRWYPFYCHLIENLIHLSLSEDVFIPVLPLLLRILTRLSFPIKKGDKESETERVFTIDLLNHVSLDEAQLPEYQEAVANKIHDLLTLYVSGQCYKIAFPELIFLPSVQMRKWLKTNPGKPAQKFKSIIAMMKADSDKIEDARKSIEFAFTDYSAVDAWQKKMKDSNKLSCLPK